MTKRTKSRRNREALRKGNSSGNSGLHGNGKTAGPLQNQPHFLEAPIARAVRLATEQTPSQWDVLNDMYRKMVSLMDHWINRVAPILSDPVLLAYLTEQLDYSALLVQFRCDMEQLTKELVALHRAHAGKTGGTDDPDENLQAAMLFEQYVMWQLRHDQTIIPIVNHLLEFTHDAELAIAHTQHEKSAQVRTSVDDCCDSLPAKATDDSGEDSEALGANNTDRGLAK